MKRTYQNVSAVLDKKQMKELGWQSFQGTVSDFKELQGKILKDGSIIEEYKGMEGYAKFAGEHYSNQMKKAYQKFLH